MIGLERDEFGGIIDGPIENAPAATIATPQTDQFGGVIDTGTPPSPAPVAPATPEYHTGMATTFGYRDSQDSGRGSPIFDPERRGISTNNTHLMGASIRQEYLAQVLGPDPAKWSGEQARSLRVEVQGPNGLTEILPLVDVGPGAPGIDVDLTEAARQRLGHNGRQPVQWRLLGADGAALPINRNVDEFGGIVEDAPAGPGPGRDEFGGILEQDLGSDIPNALIQGATSEGIYAGIEGASRSLGNVIAPAWNPARGMGVKARREAREQLTGVYNALATSQQAAESQPLLRTMATQINQLHDADKPMETDEILRDAAGFTLGKFADEAKDRREDFRREFPVSQEFQNSIFGGVVQGLGQAVVTLPTYIVPGMGPAMTVGQIYQEGYDDARRSGVSPEAAHSAAMKYLPAAALDVISDKLIIGKLLKPLKGKMTVGQFMTGILVSGGMEGFTEGAQQGWLNYVAKELAKYDPKRKLDDEVIKSAIIGGLVGSSVTAAGSGVPMVAQNVIERRIAAENQQSAPPVETEPDGPLPGESDAFTRPPEAAPVEAAPVEAAPVEAAPVAAAPVAAAPVAAAPVAAAPVAAAPVAAAPVAAAPVAAAPVAAVPVAAAPAASTTTETPATAAAARVAIRAYREAGIRNAPPVQVVQRMDQVPADTATGGVIRTASAAGNIVEGFYDAATRGITIILDGAAQIAAARGISLDTRLAQLALHEQTHHMGAIGALFTGRDRAEYNGIVNMVLSALPAPMRKTIQSLYNFNTDSAEGRSRLAEEYLARVAELPGKLPAWADRALARIAALVRRVFKNTKMTKAEVRDLLNAARRRGDEMLSRSNDNAETETQDNAGAAFSLSENIGASVAKAIKAGEIPNFTDKAKHLTPEEQAKFKINTAKKFVQIFNSLPSEKEFAAVALGGQAKRGWYEASTEAIIQVFGLDAPRFAALLAATSPQTSVESNLFNALNIWKDWIAAGRPTDRASILRIMGESVQGGKGEKSVLDAWVNNTVRSLATANALEIVISGPKVNSFMLNLRGVVNEVTNDAWMANFALVDQTIFAGSLSADGTEPGKSPGYMAMSAKVRAAATYLTKLTGETWTPAEVQETVWSWAKTLYELQDRRGENRDALEILRAGELTNEAIASTPDFATLLNYGPYKQVLTEAGYGAAIAGLRGDGDGSNASGEAQRRFAPEAGSAVTEIIRRGQERAAARLAKLYKLRAAEKKANAAAALSLSQQPTPETKPRAFTESAKTAPGVMDDVKALLGSFYKVFSDRDAIDQAKDYINRVDLEAAAQRVMSTGPGNAPTKLDTVIGIELVSRFQALGNFERVSQLIEHISENATSQGQAIQALHLLSHLDSLEGIQYYAMREISKVVSKSKQLKERQAEIKQLREELSEMQVRAGTMAVLDQQDLLKSLGLDPAKLVDINLRLRELLIQTGSNPVAAKQKLTELLVKETGMAPGQAGRIAERAVAIFRREARKARTRLLNTMIRNKRFAGLKVPPGQLAKWQVLNDTGALTDAAMFEKIATAMGLPVFTREMAARVKTAIESYNRAPDGPVKLARGAAMLESIHDQIPSTIGSKMRTWQVLALLLSPLAAIRNIIGNTTQLALNVTADTVSALTIDPVLTVTTGATTAPRPNLRERAAGLTAPVRDFLEGYQVAKAEGTGTRGALTEGVKTLLANAKLTTAGAMEIGDLNNHYRHTFSNRFMRLIEDTLALGLGTFDRAFHQSAYLNSLRRQMDAARANGVGIFSPTREMVEQARLDASRAIYQEETFATKAVAEIVKGLNKISTAGKMPEFGLGSAVVTFAKVPLNIMTEAVRWTPLGFLQTIYGATRPGPEGIGQRELVDGFTRALLGTGSMAIGYWLAQIGLLSAKGEDDKDLEAMRKASGLGAYKLNVSGLKRALMSGNWWTPQPTLEGDQLMGYNWLQPAAIPVAAGAQIALERAKGENAGAMSLAWAAGSGGVRSLEDLPMLAGVKNLARSITQSGSAIEGSAAAMLQLPGTMVPTLLRKAADIGDNTVRETRGAGPFQKPFDDILSRLPGGADRYPPRYDLFGVAQERYQYGTNSVWNVLFNPVMVTRVKTSPLVQELERIHAVTGESSAIPGSRQARNVEINGQKIELTNSQIAAMQRYTGQLSSELFNRVIAAPNWARLPEAARASYMSAWLSQIQGAAKIEILGDRPVSVSARGKANIDSGALRMMILGRQLGIPTTAE